MNEKKTQKVVRYTLVEDKTRKKKKEQPKQTGSLPTLMVKKEPEKKPKGLRGLFKKKG